MSCGWKYSPKSQKICSLLPRVPALLGVMQSLMQMGHILLHLLPNPTCCQTFYQNFQVVFKSPGCFWTEDQWNQVWNFLKKKTKIKILKYHWSWKLNLFLENINSKTSLNFQRNCNPWESTQINWTVQSAFQLLCRTAALPKLLILTSQSPRKHQKTLDIFYEIFCTEFLFHKFQSSYLISRHSKVLKKGIYVCLVFIFFPHTSFILHLLNLKTKLTKEFGGFWSGNVQWQTFQKTNTSDSSRTAVSSFHKYNTT